MKVAVLCILLGGFLHWAGEQYGLYITDMALFKIGYVKTAGIPVHGSMSDTTTTFDGIK